MIYNKSTHPVEVKKISLRLWSLRDEIESAIGRRMRECEAAGIPLYIDDIKQFYNLNSSIDTSNVIPLHPNEGDDGMTKLMESITDSDAPSDEEGALKEAQDIIAEQTQQGLENKIPHPSLERPFQRQAPDLDSISYGFTFLSDINMDSFLSFTKNKFLHGQSVVVEFLIPQPFMMTAEVTYSHHYAMNSRIISDSRSNYRLKCKFSYSLRGERENLRNFLKSVEPNLPDKKKEKNEDQDDSLET